MLIITRNTIFIGSIFFSIHAHASPESIQPLMNELNSVKLEHATAIFLVKPNDINLSKIKHYLSNSTKTNICDEKSNGEPEYCNQKKTCSPKIEFKKINPTKYRIKIFHACRNFTLIFNERFDRMWKLYITKTRNTDRNPSDGKNIIEQISNKEDSFDNPYGSIENSRLKNSPIWETWFSSVLTWGTHNNTDMIKVHDNKLLIDGKPWSTSNGLNDESIKWPGLLHWEANAYANGWMLDLHQIKALPLSMSNHNSFYSTNSDGSVNFDVVIEYWPQRLYYLAYLISVLSISLCVGIVSFVNIKKAMSKNSNNLDAKQK